MRSGSTWVHHGRGLEIHVEDVVLDDLDAVIQAENRMRARAWRQRSGIPSTPTARAPNFCAAVMTTRPSPLPRS